MADRSLVKEEEFKSTLIHASVEIGEISAIGGLPKETIQKVIQQQIPSLKLHYQNALDKKHDLKGQLIFQLTADSKGKVTKVTLVSSKLNDKDLEKSFIQKIKELNFPKLERRVNESITISFNLKTSWKTSPQKKEGKWVPPLFTHSMILPTAFGSHFC